MLIRATAVVVSLTLATGAHSADDAGTHDTADATRTWAFAVTAYPTDVRGGENYTSVIAAADRGPVHLEARYNYESIGGRSV